MDILFFESMRAFKGARGRVILKVRLPRLSYEGAEDFNAFYRSLADIYSEAAMSLAANTEHDCRLSVSFKAEEMRAEGKRGKRGRLYLLIGRRVCLKEETALRTIESYDKYDLQSQVFLK